MATSNNLTSNVMTKVLRKFLPEYETEIVSLKSVDTGELIPSGSINPMTGDTVYIKRPHKYVPVSTASGDISSSGSNDIISGRAAATVQNHETIKIQWEALEEAIELDQLEQIIAPAAGELVTEIELNLNEFIKNNSAHQLGTAGNAISKWSDISNVDSYTTALGFPSGMVYGQVNSYARRNLADSIKGIFSQSDAMTAWERARIPNMTGGLELFMSNTLKSHTTGDWDAGLQLNAAPTQTYVSGKDTFQTTMVLKGADTSVTGFLKAGDVLQITGRAFNNFKSREQASGEGGAALLYTGTVNADADSDGGGLVTVVLNGPAFYESGGQYNTISSALDTADVVTLISGTASTAYVPNLFYHKSAFSVGSVAQKRLKGWETRFATKDGLQIRFTDYSDGDKNENYLRLDVVPIFAALNPLLAGKFYGE